MKTALKAFEQELDAIREAGTWREERIITTPQRACIDTTQKSHVVNMRANNYLGLSDDPRLIEAAKASYDRWGFGLSSVRFICGTQEIHKELERRIAKFAGTDDAILYSSCFDANGGLFETLLGPEDAVISDELNHASIIDGVRLCKAKRYRYLNNNMEDLEAKLKDARESGCKKILIATDGVFSMGGDIANLPEICALAQKYGARVMVDDAHGLGVIGEGGRGTASYYGLEDQVDIYMGTFSKSLASLGGYMAASEEVADYVRHASRPFIFSASIPPANCAAALTALRILEREPDRVTTLQENALYLRKKLDEKHIKMRESNGQRVPIVPIYTYEEIPTLTIAKDLYEHGVYVNSSLPPAAAPHECLLRTSLMATHTHALIDEAVDIIAEVLGRYDL